MKKSLLIFALMGAMFASQAQAESLGVEYVHDNAGADTMVMYPSVNAVGLTFDARLAAKRGNNTALTDSGELRVRKTFAITDTTSLWTRVGLGESYSNNTKYSFIGIEQAVAYKFTDKVNSYVSYKYSNALADLDGKKTGLGTLAVNYNVTKTDTVTGKVMTYWGDSAATNALSLTYTRNFN